MRYPSFVGSSYRSQSPIADTEALVNWYVEQIESPGAKSQSALYPTPGLNELLTLGVSGTRALYAVNGRAFAVVADRLFELLPNISVIQRGTNLNDLDGSPATIQSNGDGGGQLFITSGSKGYLYNLDNSAPASLVLDGANIGGFLDGFFLALDTSTSTLKISELFDGATWDPLQVAQRNDAADKWISMIVSHKEIWLFGSQTTSVYYNAGASDFPFIPNPSVQINVGILAPYSVATLDNAPIWLGQSANGTGVIYRANGYTPQRVSNHALEFALSTYATLTDAQAWTYEEQGHSFYVLTFPTADVTWVYDAATGQWHQRGDWNGTEYTSLPVYGHMYAFGKHVTGDRFSGALYEMSVAFPSDSTGRTIRRMRRAPHLSNEGKGLIFDRLQIDLETGLGVSSGQGEDPQLMLRWSDDGGQTWSNERWASAGRMGAYRARAIWRRLGYSRDRVFELAVSDPIPWRINDAWIDVRPAVS